MMYGLWVRKSIWHEKRGEEREEKERDRGMGFLFAFKIAPK